MAATPRKFKDADESVKDKWAEIHEYRTVLSTAARKGDVYRVSLILEHADIDVNFTNPELKFLDSSEYSPVMPPLHSACQAGQFEVVKVLLKCEGILVNLVYDKMTPLSAAIENGYVEIMKLLLENGALHGCRFTKKAWECPSLLYHAVHHGQYEAAAYLLSNGANAYVPNFVLLSDRYVLLLAAAQVGNLGLVKMLLRNQQVSQVQPDSGSSALSALSLACKGGHTECVQVLIEHGADVNESEEDTPLMCAVEKGHTDCVRLLLQNGAQLNRSLLMLASREGHLDIVRLLLDNGANINGVSELPADSTECTTAPIPPLLVACQTGQLEVVKVLVKCDGIVVNFVCDSETPLSAAAKNGHVNVMKTLIENGAKVNYVGCSTWSALYMAACNNQYEAAKLLLQNGANVDACYTTSDFHTPLMAAAQCGHANLVNLLLENGAEMHSRNPRIISPALTLASMGGHIECVRLLILYGASINDESEDGTPLTCAAENGHTECTKLLLEKQANVNKPNCFSYTPLMLASQENHINDVRLLLEHGAKVNERAYGDTALALADRNHHFKVVDLLIQYAAIADEEDSPPGSSSSSAEEDSGDDIL